jgi:CubicO group peptidase (beta-lactamase class C family)
MSQKTSMQIGRVAWLGVAMAMLASLGAAQDSRSTWLWPTSTPRAVGLDPKGLADFDADLASGKYGYVDSMLVIRYGKVVYDRSYNHDYDHIYGENARKPGPLNAHDPSGPYNYFNPWWHPFYRRGDIHTMQSVTKTITSVVIGIAVTEGIFPDLDIPILKFLDPSKVGNLDERKRRITVRHLLTMTSGLDWNEDLPYNDPGNTCSIMEASADWIQYVIDRPMVNDPGAVFYYSSGGAELLSRVFEAATGKDIEEYAHNNLFSPLGISNYYWKRTPTGLEDTEGGLYLNPHDLAKVGLLFLQHGVWKGKQIVQGDWVRASVTPATTVSPEGTKYGYLWWLHPYGDPPGHLAWAAHGFGGQRLIVMPEYEMVMVFTGWNTLPGQPVLSPTTAIDRVFRSIVESHRKTQTNEANPVHGRDDRRRPVLALDPAT